MPCEEGYYGCTSLDDFYVGVLPEYYLQHALVEEPLLQGLTADELRGLFFVRGATPVHIVVLVHHQAATITLHVVSSLSDSLSKLDASDHSLDLLQSLKLLLKVCALQEPQRHVELINLNELCCFRIR